MDEDLKLGMYIIVVLCLIVIAMSQYNMAYGAMSFMQGEPLGKALQAANSGPDLRFASRLSTPGQSEFIGTGSTEPPVFWNMGSVEDTDAALQSASKQPEPSVSAMIGGRYENSPNTYSAAEIAVGRGF